MLIVIRIYLILAAATIARAESLRWSYAVHVGGTAFDAASSWGRAEATPWLGQRFGWRGLAVKASACGSSILVSELVARRHPTARKILSRIQLSLGFGY